MYRYIFMMTMDNLEQFVDFLQRFVYFCLIPLVLGTYSQISSYLARGREVKSRGCKTKWRGNTREERLLKGILQRRKFVRVRHRKHNNGDKRGGPQATIWRNPKTEKKYLKRSEHIEKLEDMRFFRCKTTFTWLTYPLMKN